MWCEDWSLDLGEFFWSGATGAVLLLISEQCDLQMKSTLRLGKSLRADKRAARGDDLLKG